MTDHSENPLTLTAPLMPKGPERNPRPPEGVSRRDIAALLGIIGVATLAGCAAEDARAAGDSPQPAPEKTGAAPQALSGTDIRWVDTVLGAPATAGRTGDLATQTATQLGATVVIAKGCVTPGDGGGGIFYWSTTSATDDGGTIIVPGTSGSQNIGVAGACWRRIETDHFNVMWYGALADGVTDDLTAIQRAIIAASTFRIGIYTGGGSVYMPAGQYYISQNYESALGPAPWSGYSGLPYIAIRGRISLIGEGAYSTWIRKFGADSTTIMFDSADAQLSEVAHLHFGPQENSVPTTGSAIFFNHYGILGVRIHDIYIDGAYQGIYCAPGPSNSQTVNEVVIRDAKINVLNLGIYLAYAINWTIENVVVQVPISVGGSSVYGIFLDTWSQGCFFSDVYVLGGEHCWRFNRSAGGSTDRPPTEHRFYHCAGDNGGVSCFYATALHRCVFHGCWASTQMYNGSISPSGGNAASAFVIDASNTTNRVYGLTWENGQIINTVGHGFSIVCTGGTTQGVNGGSHFTIVDSTFSNWGQDAGHSHAYSGIVIQGDAWTSFIVTNNVFIVDDPDLGVNTLGWQGITIQQSASPAPFGYSKYVVCNNIGTNLIGYGLQGTNVNSTLISHDTRTGVGADAARSRLWAPTGSNL